MISSARNSCYEKTLTIVCVRITIINKAYPHPTHDRRQSLVRLRLVLEWIHRHRVLIAQTFKVVEDEGDFLKMRRARGWGHTIDEHVEMVSVTANVVCRVGLRYEASQPVLTQITCICCSTLPLYT